jgi:hypothetical protein
MSIAMESYAVHRSDTDGPARRRPRLIPLPGWDEDEERLIADVVLFVRRRVDRAVAATSDIARESEALRRDFLGASIQAFAVAGGDPVPASELLHDHIEELALQVADLGGTSDHLAAAFDRALQETTAALGVAERMGLRVPAAPYPRKLQAFVHLVKSEAVAALDRVLFRRDLDPDLARHLLRRALFYRPPHAYLTDVLEKAKDIEAAGTVVAVVAASGHLPSTWQTSPHVLPGLSVTEALCPPDLLPRPEDLPLGTRLVVGPGVAWADATAALTDARKLASMLQRGEVRDERPVVPTSDWVAEVCLRTNDGDADTLITRHLGPLAALSPKRRLTLVETLLRRLESGLPANQLAEAMGVPTQTLHSRLNRLRDLIGDRWLADERLHNELMIAARAAIRRWAAPATH